MKILLIDPPGFQQGINNGLAYIKSAIISHNNECKILDLNNTNLSIDNIYETIQNFKPDFIGYSIKTATFYKALNLARKIKNKFHIPQIAGGVHIFIEEKNFYKENNDIFDLVIEGEVEEEIVDILEKFREKKYIKTKLIQNIDYLNFPDFVDFDISLIKERYPLLTSRGCPYNCIYCLVPHLAHQKIRNRTIDNVIAELIYAKKNYKINKFEVIDDCFNSSINRVIEFCEKLLINNLNLKWSCPNGIRAKQVNKEMARLMKKSGCDSIVLGIESFDKQVFENINKNETIEDIEKAIKIFKEIDIRVGGYFIIGLPYDNFKKNIFSFKKAKKLNLDWAHFNILSLYPKTVVWDWYDKNGKIAGDYKKAIHFGEKINPIFETKQFSKKKIIKTYKILHTRQFLFNLLIDEKSNPLIKKIKIFYLLCRYYPEFFSKQIKDFIRYFFKVFFKILIFEFEKTKINLCNISRKEEINNFNNKKKDIRKILFINPFFYMAGGTERYLITLARYLVRQNIKVIIICTDYNSDLIKDFKINVYKIENIFFKYDLEINEENILKDIILKEKPDIIHLHNVYNPAITDICNKLSITIRTIHDYYSICPALNKILRESNQICKKSLGFYCLFKYLKEHCTGIEIKNLFIQINNKIREMNTIKRLKKIVVASNYMKEELKKAGFLKNKIEIINYFTEIEELVKNYKIDYDEKIIFAYGRLSIPDKGFDYLIEALYYTKTDYKAIIAGDGFAIDFLKQKTVDLNLQHKIKFTGWLNKSEISKYLSICRLVAVPSMWAEPFGIVGIESMFFAKPVIAFDVGGVHEWLENNVNGFLIKRGETSQMAEKIKLLLETPELAQKMGSQGQNIAKKRFSKEVHIKKLLNLYNEVLN